MVKRHIAALAVTLIVSAAPFHLADGAPGRVPGGPQAAVGATELGFGSWEFTGRDKAGAAWTGKLIVEKVDAGMFDPQKYVAQGRLDISSADGSGKGALAPVKYDSATRVFTMGGESDYGGQVYTAVLSADGKSLDKGTWRETERLSSEKTKRLVSEGEWSAKRIDK